MNPIKSLVASWPNKDRLMPTLFIGHGSPINALEDNEFTRNWVKLAREIPKPEAIVCISAHWLTRGTQVTAMDAPRTIHDFGGFGQELYKVHYPAKGNAQLAQVTKSLVSKTRVGLDHEWGLDHGTWSILKHMFPDATIPVLQLSIDYHKSPQYHFDLAKQIYALRQKGVLIVGSGNLVHNLGMADASRGFAADVNGIYPEYAYDWAIEFNEKLKAYLQGGDFQGAVEYQKLGKIAQLAHPSPDHFYPLLYTIGLANPDEEVRIFNDKCFAGSLSMTSVVFGSSSPV